MARKKRPRKRVNQHDEDPYVPPPKPEPLWIPGEPMCRNCGETISREQHDTPCVKCGRLIRFEE